MKGRLLCLALLPVCAAAQLQLFLVGGGVERPAQDIVDLGTVDASDRSDVTFRVRNASGAPVVWQQLKVAGTGFSIAQQPTLPLSLPAGGAAEFTVRFQPEGPGAYSAVLSVNALSVILRAGAVSGALLWLETQGGRLKLSSGATVDFGAVERGATRSHRFSLENPTSEELAIAELAVNGGAFRGPLGVELPLRLGPQRSASFEIAFEPTAAGRHEGALRLGTRLFRLAGEAIEPPTPKPLLVLEPAAPRSGQQVRLAVRFAEPVRSPAQGELRLRFEPAMPGVPDDPAIGFLSPVGRVLTFSVEPGEQAARFGGGAEAIMQTGTTAGRLILTVQLGGQVAESVIVLASQPVVIDTVRAARNAGGVEVNVTAFDNTRSASQIAFTFYDREGRVLEPGTISADATGEFRRYFESSTLGGVFALRAQFPVSGEAGRIAAVEVEVRNAVGATRSARTSF